MPTLTYVKFEVFVEDLIRAKHNLDAAQDVVKILLTNTAPDAANDEVLADITEIGAGFGYTAGGSDIQNAVSRTGGTAEMTGVDFSWTAAGGAIGPFQWLVMYNSTEASGALMSYWDIGSATTLNDGDSLSVQFAANVLQIT